MAAGEKSREKGHNDKEANWEVQAADWLVAANFAMAGVCRVSTTAARKSFEKKQLEGQQKKGQSVE